MNSSENLNISSSSAAVALSKSSFSEKLNSNVTQSSTYGRTTCLLPSESSASSSFIQNTQKDICAAVSPVEYSSSLSPSAALPIVASHIECGRLDISDEEMPVDGLSPIEEDVYESIKTIRDPEYPSCTLGRLRVITPQSVSVNTSPELSYSVIGVTFKPTAKHCSLAALIGLTIFMKLHREYDEQKYKIEVFVENGSHDDVTNINKLCNDKERIAAAMENPEIMSLVENAIQDYDD